MIAFFVRAEPKGQPRAKSSRRFVGGKVTTHIYTPDASSGFKVATQAEAHQHKPAQPFLGPVMVDIAAFFPRPKWHYRTGKNAHLRRDDAPEWHTCKPDTDNLQKVVLDALTSVGFWRDDAQVCAARVTKKYADERGQVGCLIEVKEAK